MKKRTVITTEKHEVWVIGHASEVPASGAQAPETAIRESASSNQSLTALPEEHPDKKKTTDEQETFERGRVLCHAANSKHFCSQCAAETNFLTLDQAVSLAKIGMRETMRRVEAQELHALETTSGHLLICQNSLNAG